MYTTRHRLIAYILLISHSLMSCYNNSIVEGQQQISQQDNQEKATRLHIKREKQQEGSELQAITISTPSLAVSREEALPSPVQQEPAKLWALQTPTKKERLAPFNHPPDNRPNNNTDAEALLGTPPEKKFTFHINQSATSFIYWPESSQGGAQTQRVF